jgi:hypothetical protein
LETEAIIRVAIFIRFAFDIYDEGFDVECLGHIFIIREILGVLVFGSGGRVGQ